MRHAFFVVFLLCIRARLHRLRKKSEKVNLVVRGENKDAHICPLNYFWALGDGFLSPFLNVLLHSFDFFRKLFSRAVQGLKNLGLKSLREDQKRGHRSLRFECGGSPLLQQGELDFSPAEKSFHR